MPTLTGTYFDVDTDCLLPGGVLDSGGDDGGVARGGVGHDHPRRRHGEHGALRTKQSARVPNVAVHFAAARQPLHTGTTRCISGVSAKFTLAGSS